WSRAGCRYHGCPSEHHPHSTAFVDAQLEEVVTRAERAELLGRLLRAVGGELRGRLVSSHPATRVVRHVVVTLADTGWDRLLDTCEQTLERVGELPLGEVEL